MNYFKSLGGGAILVGTIALESLFAAGVWYMIAIGLTPALGTIGAGILAAIVAPVIALMAIVLFVWGHRLKQIILEWEAENGKKYNEEHEVYFNKPSSTWIVSAMRWIVLLADTAGILFRVFQESLPWYGYILLIIVFELLAVSPWLVGTLVHIVANRPAYAIKRDIAYIKDVTKAQDELDDYLKNRKRKPAPETARVAGKGPQTQIEGPKSDALRPYQATVESVNMNQNGK